MPKLLQINSNLNTGSAGRIVEQIGELAIKNGWDSYVAFGRSCNKSTSTPIKIGNRFSVLYHGFISLFFDKHGLASAYATKKLVGQIERIKPDVIHLHGLHGYYLNYKILFEYLNKSKIHIVWTMHDFWAVTGHCSYFSDINCKKWETECSNCPKIKNYPTSLVYDRSYKNFSLKRELFKNRKDMFIVSVSDWMGDLMKKSFLNRCNLEVVLNGVDVEKFKETENALKIRFKYNLTEKFILLSVATNWGPRKGWDDLMLLSDSLSDDFQIIMIGLNKKQLSKLPSNIIGIERTESQEELAEYYSAADVVLSLSSQETFGLTIAEGLSCGTPGIVYNCTASPELISQDTGIIVEKGNLQILIEAILTIKKRGKQYYKNKCRNRAVDLFNKNKNFRRYIDIYNSFIDTNEYK
jgi:putative colanic acid biosynthesis glycosyltransferase